MIIASKKELEKLKPLVKRFPKGSFRRSAVPELARGGDVRFVAPAELASG